MTPLSVHEIRSTPALAALEREWWELWRRSSAATPFQSPAWLLPWWRAFAPGNLLTLAVRCDGRLVGLAPFYVERGPRGRRILPLGISVSDYLDVLADDRCGDAVCDALARYMGGPALEWDEWEFTELAPSAAALRLQTPEECAEWADAVSACPVLDLPPSVDGLAGAIPRRKRRDVRAARHRAERRGAVRIVAATSADAADFVADLVALHRARWESRGEGGVLADSRVQKFHTDAVPLLVQAGIARLYTLRVGDRVAGVYYGLIHDRCAYGYLTGFDPLFEFESPGTVLVGWAIEEAVRDGAREFHFLRGRERYKYQWGARDRWNRRRVFRRALAHACAS